ncbi:MAG: hypothetical protein OXL41_06045 [Nitrospinae bacterium]|nr:hypothetical protein [Nitrospinota bacterium]
MSASYRFCGIDTGDVCALAVRERREGRPVRWVYFESPPVERLIERCRAVFSGLGVEAFVVDGGPHTQAARAVYDLAPDAGFIWRHTEGEMQTKEVSFLGVERRHVRMNREDLLDHLVEEFHEGVGRVLLPQPKDSSEEALLGEVERHLMNLRKKPRIRSSGETVLAYARNENHFGFACAYARLAESLAQSEGMLAPLAGGTVMPQTYHQRMLKRR